MTKKGSLSPEAKESIKEALTELKEGGVKMTDIEILPSSAHTKADYQRIVDVIRGGEAYIMEVRCSRNTIYNVRKALTNPNAPWNVSVDPKDSKKTTPRTDAIKNVKFGQVKGTKNTALYLA